MSETQKPAPTLERYADWLDTRFRIPGTGITFGLDFLIGLFPVVGDIISFSLSGGLLLLMIKKGASGKALALMILNILLDAVFGSLPIVGDLFDLFFKANKRNLNLFQDHFEEGEYEGSAWSVIWTVVFVLLLLIIVLTWGLVKLLAWLFDQFATVW